jgi:hypothetical protein
LRRLTVPDVENFDLRSLSGFEVEQQTLDITTSQLVERGFEAPKRELNRTGRSPVNIE